MSAVPRVAGNDPRSNIFGVAAALDPSERNSIMFMDIHTGRVGAFG